MKQLIVDSNILVRLVVEDDRAQLAKATEFVEEVEKGLVRAKISVLVINEVVWILGKYYSLERDKFIPDLLKFLALPGVKIIEIKKEALVEILNSMMARMIDFTDLYLLKISSPHAPVFSFDDDFKKLAKS